MTDAAHKNADYQFDVSILIPMFNEENTIAFILNKVVKSLNGMNYQIVVIDDGSSDQSKEFVEKFKSFNPEVPLIYHYQHNQGKGAAIRSAIKLAQGEVLVVQDADLEYDPNDIPKLLEPFSDNALCVYGSRNLVTENRQHSTLIFYWGGLLVTYVTNWLFGSRLTDEATGYKLFHASVFDQLTFQHNDFAWEPEVTAKMLKKNISIIEKPIQYHPRNKHQGKKISWKDGVKAIFVLMVEFLRK